MSNNDFMMRIIATLNNQLSKRQLKSDLKTLNDSMYVKVIAKLSTTLSKRQLKKDLKELNDLYVKIGANLNIDKNLKSKLQNRVKELQASISDIEIKTKVAGTKLNADIDSVRRGAQTRANRSPVSFDFEIKKNKAISDIEYLGKRFSKLFSNVSAKQKYQSLLTSAYSISDASQLRSVRTQISAFTSELKANGLASKSLGDRWKSLIDKGKDLFSAASITSAVFSQMRKSVSTFLQLDTAMTNLYKVQDQITSREQFSGLLLKWNKLAQDLSLTTESLINSSAEWSKIGFNLDMSEQLAQITAIFEKTAEISNEKANSTLISIAQAFPEIDDLGEEDYIERVQAIGNKINKVGNDFAIDSEGVSDALQNSSAALRMANNSLDESIAILAAANKIFQSPDEVGNMSKILAARLRGQRGELEALNEDTDGLIESVNKIQTQILNLTHNKVNIFEADNETLKSTYDIIQEIGKVYDTLSDKDQADLLEIIAGKQRMSAVASLLMNYEEMEKIKSASMNADNSMQQEFDRYLESAEAHLVTFQQKLIETYSTFMSGDLIKYAADTGSAILDLVNSTELLRHGLLAVLALNFGKGISAIGAGVSSAVMQMNTLGAALQQVKNLPLDNALRDGAILQLGESTKALTEKNLKLLLSQKQLSNEDRINTLVLHGLTEEEAIAKLEKMGLTTATNAQTAANTAETVSTFTLSGALNALKASAVGAWTAFKAAFAANPIGMALTIATTLFSVISMINSKVEEQAQVLEDAKNKFSETTNEIKSLNDELMSTQDKIKELQKLADNGTISVADENELKLLKETNDELERKIALKQKEQIDDAKNLLKEAQKVIRKDDLYSYAHYNDEGKFVTVTKHDNVINRLQDRIEQYQDAIKHFGKDKINTDNYDKAISEDAESVGNLVEAYQSLKDAGIKLTKEQQAEYDSAMKAQDAYLLYSYNLNKTKEGFQALNEEQQRSILSNKLLEQGLTEQEVKVVLKYIPKEDLDDYYDFSFPLPDKNDYKTAEEYGKAYAEAWKNGVDSVTQSSKKEAKPTSFKQAWKALDNVDSNSDQKDLKKDLLELAKQGKLTVAEFNKTTGAKSWLKQIGMDAEEAVKKINNLKSVSSADQLSSMKSGISSISSALGEKKTNLSKKATANDGISIDTLSSMPDDLKSCRKEYEKFCEVLGDGSSTMEECEEAANKLATAYINNGNFLAKLTSKNKDYYISVLKEMGVENAEQIVIDALNRKKAEAAIQTMDFTNKTGEEIVKLLEEQGALNGTTEALKLYALKKIYANGNGLNTTQDIDQLIALVKSLGYSTEALDKYKEALNSSFKPAKDQQEAMDTVNDILNGKKKVSDLIKERNEYVNQQRTNASADINGIIAKMEGTKVTPTISSTSDKTSSNGKVKSAKAKESKQQIDWLSRMLTTLQNKVDILKAKFENLFSVGKKKNNLTDQIQKTKKLLNAQEKAASRYQKIADKYYKKNKKKLSKNGITLSMLKNGSYDVKSYKSSIAEIIQTYEDYIDKANDAKKAAIETKTAIRELKIQRNQLYVDRADSKLSAFDAQAENQKNAKDTNKILQKKVKWTKEYYKYQIKNAKLEKDATKEAELRAQKKKALLDIEIEQNQNLADDREAHYNLNQKREDNAVSAKEKNKYEADSLKNKKDQYKYLKEIAKLEHGIKSAEYKLLQEEEKAATGESYKKMYDNIKAEYDNATSLNDARVATVQAEIATLEAAGKSATKEMYSNMMKVNSDTREQLLKQRAELEEAGKNFEYGSDEWYAWQNDIEAVNQGLYNCTQNVIEFQKKVNELDLKKFKLIAAQLDATKSHLDFLVDMLSHEDLTDKESGGFTDAGMATVSLRFSNIDNHKKIVENAQNELKKLYEQHLDGSDGLNEEEFLAKREEQLDIIRDSISAIADEKDAILDLVENALQVQIDSINDLIEKKKTALSQEKEYWEYQKRIAKQTKNIALIQKQIAALSGDHSEEARAKLQKLQLSLEDAHEELRDTEYDRWYDDQTDMLDNLADEVEDFWERIMNDLRKDINGSLDNLMQMVIDNPEAVARAFDTLGLGDALSIITTSNGDGTHSDSAIDYGGNSYESTYDDETGTNTKNKFDTSIDNINSAPGNLSNAADELIKQMEVEAKYMEEQAKLKAQLREHEEKVRQEAIQKEKDKTAAYQRADDIMKHVNNGDKNFMIDANVSKSGVQAAIEEFLNGGALHEPKTESGKKRMETDPLLKYIAKNYGGKTLSNLNEARLGAFLGIAVKNPNSVTNDEAKRIKDAFKNAGFAKGGMASTLNKAAKDNDDDGIITIQRGEAVLTKEETKALQGVADHLVSMGLPYTEEQLNILREYQSKPLDFSSRMQQYGNAPFSNTNNTSVNVGGITIQVEGSGVTNPDSFCEALHRSTKMQKSIQDATIGQIAKPYGNSLII